MSDPYVAPTADSLQPFSSDTRYEPKVFAVNGRIGRLRYLAYSMLSALVAIAASVVIGILAAIAMGVGMLFGSGTDGSNEY